MRPSGDLDKSLVNTWALLPHRQMCIRFDVINPLMQFKRGSNRSDDPNVPFPRYNPSPKEDPDVMEVDDEDNPLELYEPFFLAQCVSDGLIQPCITNLGGWALGVHTFGG